MQEEGGVRAAEANVMNLLRRIRWAWMVARYGEPLARAWIALENFERRHCKPKTRREGPTS